MSSKVRTAAGQAYLHKLRRDDEGMQKLSSGRFHLGALITDAEDAVRAIEEEASLDETVLAQAIHAFNITVGDCDHDTGIADCVDRAGEYGDEYLRLLAQKKS